VPRRRLAAARRVATSLRSARHRIPRWRLRDDGFRALRSGLCRIYAQGRAAWHKAGADPTDERLHEWRKRVKDLRYVLELLEPLWPKRMAALADEVDDLADRLGEDHDLAMLGRFVLEVDGPDDRDGDVVMAAIAASRRDLQSEAWMLAARVFEASPRRFVQ